MGSILVFSLLLLTACSSLNKEDCSKMNWKEKGTEDASLGKSLDLFQDYREQCSKYGITTLENDYKEGRRLGLPKYCTYKNGYERALMVKNHL